MGEIKAAGLVLHGGRVFDASSSPHEGYAADVYVSGDRISEVRRHDDPESQERLALARQAGARLFDARRKLVAPGFVNAHYHSADVLLKGCFEPSPLEVWALDALPQSYPPRSREEIRIRTMLGAVECIRGGITTVQDMVSLLPFDTARVGTLVQAYEAVGIRTILGLAVANVSPLDSVPYWRETIPEELQREFFARPAGASSDDVLSRIDAEIGARSDRHSLIRWALAPLSPERCTPGLLERIADVSRRRSLPVYSHIYISKAEAVNARRSFAAQGGSLVDVLAEAGLLNPRLSLAHGVWLDDREIAALAEAGVNLVLNPISNLKNKNGVAPIRRLAAAGINLALGCDNCSCTDAQNIFQAMKMFALLAAVSDPEPGPPDAVDAIRAATVGGARTAALDHEIGAIRAGMKADLVVLDLDDPAFVPLNSLARQIVYSECGRSVDSVIVDGRLVMENRKILTVDEAALRQEVDAIMRSFRPEAEAVFARNRQLRPYLLEADARTWSTDIGLSRYVGSR